MTTMRQVATGTLTALVSTTALTAAMLPFRGQLSTASPALVLAVPVVIGVVIGGFRAGIISVALGFLVYEFFFIAPYQTLAVRNPQDWATLGIYVAVMLPVSKVVASLNAAKAEARRRGREIEQLFDISDLLVEDKPLESLLAMITTTVAEVFGAAQVAILLPAGGRLAVAASAGTPLSPAQLRRVLPAAGELATLDPRWAPSATDGLLVLALSAAGRPVGLLVLSSEAASAHEREPLLLFANHIALAVERVQLRDHALQARLSEEVGRHAKTLVGAVSHDLRAPLARIKASSSTLADGYLDIDPAKARELATVIDVQADRLADLVQNLLDMSRIQAGVLEPRCSVAPLADLVAAVTKDVGSERRAPIEVDIPEDLPPIDADLVLVSRVLTNLLENALRYSPRGEPVTVAAHRHGADTVEVSVTDHGPGVPPGRRQEIFELFSRRDSDVGAGLGLTIAKTFVEAHGQTIGVDEAPGGGAVFHFTLPVADAIGEEPRARPHR